MTNIRNNALVVFDKSTIELYTYEKYFAEKFEGKTFVFLGEVPQVHGHCILCDLSSGKIIGLYHTENFREATEEEC